MTRELGAIFGYEFTIASGFVTIKDFANVLNFISMKVNLFLA